MNVTIDIVQVANYSFMRMSSEMYLLLQGGVFFFLSLSLSVTAKSTKVTMR